MKCFESIWGQRCRGPRDEHQITWWRWEHAQSAGSGGDGGAPFETCVWHLILLTMKDDNAVADANFFFFTWRKMPLPHLYLHLWLQLYKEIQCIFISYIYWNHFKYCALFARLFFILFKTTRAYNNIWKPHCYQTLLRLSLQVGKSESTLLRPQPLPFRTVPWGGDRDRAMAVFCIYQLIVVLFIQWTWCCRILLPLPPRLSLMNL